jgi:hypothetical protein
MHNFAICLQFYNFQTIACSSLHIFQAFSRVSIKSIVLCISFTRLFRVYNLHAASTTSEQMPALVYHRSRSWRRENRSWKPVEPLWSPSSARAWLASRRRESRTRKCQDSTVTSRKSTKRSEIFKQWFKRQNIKQIARVKAKSGRFRSPCGVFESIRGQKKLPGLPDGILHTNNPNLGTFLRALE